MTSRSSSSSPVRVKGSLEADAVKCSCGRKVGLINEDGAEFFCRHCNVNVVIDIRESKLEKLHAIVVHNARMAVANLKIAEMIASL